MISRIILSILVAVVLFCPCAHSQAADRLPEISGSILQVPDLHGFPQGTFKIKVKLYLKHRDQLYRVRYTFKKEQATAKLLLDDVDVDAKSRLPRGTVLPEQKPPEGPIASVKNCLSAFLKRDEKTFLKYLNAKDRERAERDRGHFDAVHARHKRGAQQKGFHGLKVVLDSLPRLKSLPPNTAYLELQYQFPATVKDRRGHFKVGLELFVQESKPAHWVVDEIDVDFRTESPATQKQIHP